MKTIHIPLDQQGNPDAIPTWTSPNTSKVRATGNGGGSLVRGDVSSAINIMFWERRCDSPAATETSEELRERTGVDDESAEIIEADVRSKAQRVLGEYRRNMMPPRVAGETYCNACDRVHEAPECAT